MTGGIHRCAEGGAIVHRPAEQPVWLYQWPRRPRIALCTTLVCSECKQPVRWRSGMFRALEPDREVVGALARALQSSEDWLSVDGVESSPQHTLYSCDCFYLSESSASSAIVAHPLTGEPSRNLPWLCSGHPALSLPVGLGERPLTTASEWSEQLGQVIAGDDLLLLRDLVHCSKDGPLDEMTRAAIHERVGAGPFPPLLKQLFGVDPDAAPLSALVEEIVRGQALEAPRSLVRRTDVAVVLASAVLYERDRPDRGAMVRLLEAESAQRVLSPTIVAALSHHSPRFVLAHLEPWLEHCSPFAGLLLATATDLLMAESYASQTTLDRLTAYVRRTGLSLQELREQAAPHLQRMWADRAPLFERALAAAAPH